MIMSALKRAHQSNSDMNNNEIVLNTPTQSKKKKSNVPPKYTKPYTIGQIKELRMLNFMCHKNFSIEFHPTPMQIVTGANGSGKSTIANAICLCLGAQARTTGRTSTVQSFIRKGETSAELTITLANEGREAYKPELYGNEIRIIRRIDAKRSLYKILGGNNKVISTRKETISEIIQALSISPENPLCVLHQEVAKTFLLTNDTRKKYQFYMKVSQLDQIKQANEEASCTVQSIRQRINGMIEKHADMLRAMEPIEREVKKIDIRRDQGRKKPLLEAELLSARSVAAQKDFANLQRELDQTQKSEDIVNKQILDEEKRIQGFDEDVEKILKDRTDLEKDLRGPDGLRELNYRFCKKKKEIDFVIYRLSRDCEKHHQGMEELKQEESRLKKYLAELQTVTHQSSQKENERERLDQEIQTCQGQQSIYDRNIASFIDDVNVAEANIRAKQTTLDCARNELRQKQHDSQELKKLQANQTNVFGSSMSDCLKAIEKEHRFHRKPIGPLGQHVHCIDQRWSYAVEKHLDSMMSAFICTDNHDERLLLEIFSSCSVSHRPTIIVMTYSNKVHDISGTLGKIRRANLTSIHQVLKIDNITVECALIDYKHIEATILLNDLQEAKRLRQSGILLWEPIWKKVKVVAEAWTYDGSNVKLDKAFRIYTNDKRPARYFTSNNTQSLSVDEVNAEINDLHQQISQMDLSINELKKIRQTSAMNLEEMKKLSAANILKINELNKAVERFTVTMPAACEYSVDELQDKLKECSAAYAATSEKFEEAKVAKESKHQDREDAKQNCDNIVKKTELKTQEHNDLTEKINGIQSARLEIQQNIQRLSKKTAQFSDDKQRCQEKLDELVKTLPKKFKIPKVPPRSVREIQQELDAINTFLKSHDDTKEQRRRTIEEFKVKRDAAHSLKKTYDQCSRQLRRLETFVNKRKERFGQIAGEQDYLLQTNFQSLMREHQFEDCKIEVDHKKEELEIIIKSNRRSVASLSGGERSISTFSFLLALWGSIYQPFRLLDEIDIYMDNEKRNLSLELLYKNTEHHSSSQHVIFTPQAIDPQTWNKLDVPVFCMPTPKRLLE